MKFNTDKYKVLHLKQNKFHAKVQIVKQLSRLQYCRKGPGGHNGMETECQATVCYCYQKATSILDYVKWNTACKSREMILSLCSALWRPHLLHPFWAPYFKENVDRLERFQQWTTKIITGLGNLIYKKKLKFLELFSLEKNKAKGRFDSHFQIQRKW